MGKGLRIDGLFYFPVKAPFVLIFSYSNDRLMDMVVIAASFMFINGLKAGQRICRNLCLIRRNKGLLSIKSNRVDCRGRVAKDIVV